MITDVKRIPLTEGSHPFAAAADKCLFREHGYVEEEYFVKGTANIYERRGEHKQIRKGDVPYVNRVLIRKPEDFSRFSGNIVVEILNSTSDFDVDRMWVLESSLLMRNGDIYVGITSKPNVLRSLCVFDRQRYSCLSWANPLKYDIPDEQLGNLSGFSKHETEDGLFWDMLIDFSKLLRSDHRLNPIRDDIRGRAIYLYLTGWSQSGGYMIRFVRDFAQDEGKDLFDGYLAGGSISLCTPNLNQEDLTDILSQDRTLKGLDRPYIDVHTESDNAKWGNDSARQTKSEWYRVYDVVGSSHDTTATMEEYYRNDPDIEKISANMEFHGSEPHANEFPYALAFHAALQQLYDWVRERIRAVEIDPIVYDNQYNNVKAEDGNSIGGWRLPMITYPAVRFSDHCTPVSAEYAFGSALYGAEEPYSKEEFLAKYESRNRYLSLIRDETDRCIRKRFLLEADREECISRSMYFVDRYILA